MKKCIVFILFFSLILLSSCFNDNNEPDIPWVDALIQNAEDGTDLSHTVAIWSYEYNGELVYYTLTRSGAAYNSVYDSLGNYLGAPDGGWRNAGDSSLVNFFDSATNKTLIWVYEYPSIEGANDEYQVLNAVFRSKWPLRSYLHVLNPTYGYSENFLYQEILNERGVAYDSSIISEYLFINSIPLTMNPSRLLSTIALYSREQKDYLFEEFDYPENWNEYYRRYPRSNGLIEISRVGFSNDMTCALVTLGWQFADDGGYGYIFVCEKVNGQWLVRHELGTWVS